MKVSFDFDGAMIHVHHLADRFKRFGDELFIITSRDETKDNADLFEWADDLEIKRENIHFTNHQLKLDKIIELGINMHFDDDTVEVEEINEHSECKALLVNHKLSYSND